METNKRNTYDGFDEKTIPDRIAKIGKYSASWRWGFAFGLSGGGLSFVGGGEILEVGIHTPHETVMTLMVPFF